MWRQPGEHEAPLEERLVHEPEIEHLEVPQAAVHELAGPAGGPGCEVAGLDQAGGQAPRHCVEGAARPDDTATDDEDVKLLARLEPLDRGPGGSEGTTAAGS
jgi:hypothetical protein